MGTTLARAYVQVVPSANGIESKLKEVMGVPSESAGKDAGGKFTSFLKKAIASAGIGMALKQAFSEGAELQQNLGGTEAVFSEFASSIQQSAAKAYKNMGLSASDYMATANKMGSLFQGSGVEQQRSLELTSKAMQRAADVASVMGLDTTAAMESIAGAAKGNFTMMDNLGVAMNATTLQAYALEKGINFKWDTASNAQKAELAMQMFFEKTEQYAGNFAKESSDTISGSMDAVKAAFSNVLGNLTLGNDIQPSLQALSEVVVVFVSRNLIPAAVNIFKALPSALVTIVTTAGPALAEAAIPLVQSLGNGIVTQAPVLFENALAMIDNLKLGISEKLPEILAQGSEIITNMANGMLENLPSIITAGGSILFGLFETLEMAVPQILSSGMKLISNLGQGIVNNLPAILSAGASITAGLLAKIGENLPQILQKGIELIGKLAAGLIQGIPKAIAAIPTLISRMKSEFTNYDWGSIGKNIIEGVAKGLSNAVGTIVNAAKEAAKSAFEAAKDFLGIKSPSRLFMWIGEQTDAGLAKGLAGNTKPISEAMRSVTKLMAEEYSPKLSVESSVGYGRTVTKASEELKKGSLEERLDRIIYLLELLTKQELKMVIGEREYGRILRELGVLFA